MKNNKAIYEKIMRNISVEIKRILNEDIQSFDVTDYQEDNYIDHQTTRDIIKPKDMDEENEFFEKTEPSGDSIKRAKLLENKIQQIFQPLLEVKIPWKCLDVNHHIFYLKGYFFAVSSTFKDKIISDTWDSAVINFNYDISNDEFSLTMDTENLAKLIEFCDLYNNYIDFYFRGYEDYYNAFQFYVQDTLHFTTEVENEFIYTGNGYVPEYGINMNNIDNIFKKLCNIFKEFVDFIPIYIRKFK